MLKKMILENYSFNMARYQLIIIIRLKKFGLDQYL